MEKSIKELTTQTLENTDLQWVEYRKNVNLRIANPSRERQNPLEPEMEDDIPSFPQVINDRPRKSRREIAPANPTMGRE